VRSCRTGRGSWHRLTHPRTCCCSCVRLPLGLAAAVGQIAGCPALTVRAKGPSNVAVMGGGAKQRRRHARPNDCLTSPFTVNAGRAFTRVGTSAARLAWRSLQCSSWAEPGCIARPAADAPPPAGPPPYPPPPPQGGLRAAADGSGDQRRGAALVSRPARVSWRGARAWDREQLCHPRLCGRRQRCSSAPRRRQRSRSIRMRARKASAPRQPRRGLAAFV
jgi:hypothetical protein